MPLKDPVARRAYRTIYARKYLLDPINRQKHLKRVRANDNKKKAESQKIFDEWRSQGCCLCPEKEVRILIAHHWNPDSKAFNIGDAISRKYKPSRVQQELTKCICLCPNCHAKVHLGKRRICSSEIIPVAAGPDLTLEESITLKIEKIKNRKGSNILTVVHHETWAEIVVKYISRSVKDWNLHKAK